MLEEVFKSLIIASCMGGMLAVLLFLLKPLTSCMLGARWQFYLWLSVLIVFICPVRLENSVALPEPIHRTVEMLTVKEVPTVSFFEDDSGVYMRQTVSKTVKHGNMFAIIWVTVAVLLLTKTVCEYLFLKKKLYHNSVYKENRMGITIRQCDLVGAPLVLGCIKPVLYLPDGMLYSEYMEYIIAHERVHIARKDILIKWFSVIVKCVHWFNPAVYIIMRQINRDCEIACDAQASKSMSAEDRKKYMQTILDISENETKFKRAVSVGLTSEGRCLKERLYAVDRPKKTNAAMHISGVILFCLCTVGAITVGGIINGSLVSGAVSNEYNLILEKTETVKDDTSQTQEVEKPLISVTESNEIPDKTQVTEEEVYDTEVNTETEVKAERVIRGEFNSDGGDTRHIYGVTADEKGCITVGIRSNTQETVDVYISDSSSGREVYSMGVPVPYEAAHLMEGLEPGKTYDIMLKGEMRNDWNIKSEYVIY